MNPDAKDKEAVESLIAEINSYFTNDAQKVAE